MQLRHLAIVIVLLAGVPASALAQYFGRNKVQYERFDFEILQSEHFNVHYYPAEAAAARDAARMGERWYNRYSELFRHEFAKRKPLILYADKPDFQQTNTTAGSISEATGGFTEGLKNRVVMPFAETYPSTDHVLGHELVHAFQYDLALGGGSAAGGQGSTFFRLPLWVVEGLAEYLSVGRENTHTAMWLRDALERDELPTLDDLSTDPDYFPYRWGHAFWAYVGGNWSDSIVAVLYEVASERGIDPAIRQVLNVHPDSLSAGWQREIERQYRPFLEGRTPPTQVGDRLLSTGDENEWSLSPSISPDGARVVFLSQRGLFTIDHYVADARTGQIQGRLTSSVRNPHFDALAFLNSAGAWSPDASQFAFVTFSEGDNEIAIANIADRRVVRTIDLGDVSAVHDVAWSPDGSTLVVSGMKGGITDLFLVDLANGRVDQITRDRFAELTPTWSPDGRTIAFATDRGTEPDLERLDLPTMGIGFLDRASGDVRVERPFEGWKHINPQYSPDGGSLYFISDRGGFSDIYRLDSSTGQVYQVTNVTTGISGITEFAPALSVSRTTGQLVFSVFREGDYVGYRLDAARAQGTPVEALTEVASAALLPPGPAGQDRVAEYLAHSERGLPPGQRFATSDYSSDMTLDFVAPPSAGVAVDRFGSAIGGSVGFFFSDMLGDRQMGLAVIANGGFKDIGGEVAFADLGDRSNWGVRAGRLPFRSVTAQVAPCEVEGVTLDCVDLILERIYQSGGEVLGDYPFSTTRRVEGALGFTRYDFDFEVQRTAYQNGIPVARTEFDLDELEPDALNLATGSIALVDDFSFFGFTSPVAGGRSRFEVGGNFGTLNFATVLADYRRYFFARPVTFAMRALHYGRYGGGADGVDEEGRRRLRQLYIGYPTFVRGYDAGNFETDECSDSAEGGCPEFDRLVGSRIGVVNVEIRAPLFGAEEFGLLGAGFLPMEIAVFADGGAAWTGDESLEFDFKRRTPERIPVFSTGASLRINIFGALIGEIFYVYPFQRPDKGTHWGFQIAPGW